MPTQKKSFARKQRPAPPKRNPPPPPIQSRERSNAVDFTRDNFDVPNKKEYFKDRCFQDFGVPTHFQGWKIHVPAPKNFRMNENYAKCLNQLVKGKIPHKYVANKEMLLRHMELGLKLNEQGKVTFNYGQSGKFITIYPDGEVQLKKVVYFLNRTLNENDVSRGGLNTVDIRVGLVSIRYGGLKSAVIIAPEKLNTENAEHCAENYRMDNRKIAKPKAIRSPYAGSDTGLAGWVKFDNDPRIRNEQDQTEIDFFDPFKPGGENLPRVLVKHNIELAK